MTHKTNMRVGSQWYAANLYTLPVVRGKFVLDTKGFQWYTVPDIMGGGWWWWWWISIRCPFRSKRGRKNRSEKIKMKKMKTTRKMFCWWLSLRFFHSQVCSRLCSDGVPNVFRARALTQTLDSLFSVVSKPIVCKEICMFQHALLNQVWKLFKNSA